MRAVWQSVLSITLGFIGGVVAINTNFHFGRHQSEIRSETVRASRFELVDPSGTPLAFWGKDRQGLDVEIAFLDSKGEPRARFGTEVSQANVGRPVSSSPFAELTGSDGRARLSLRLDNSERPLMAMGDSKSENRLLLGHWQTTDVAGAKQLDSFDKWSLVFRDPSYGWRDYLDIGVTSPSGTRVRTGYAVVRNSTDREVTVQPRQ